MNDPDPLVTRREMMALTGTSALAGGSILYPGTRRSRRDATQQAYPQVDDDRETETVRAFVGSYHWGYFVLDEDGSELDQLTLTSGTELRLTLFNVEADDAVDALPRAVRRNIPSSEERAERNEDSIPVPRGTSLERLHEVAESTYPDHSLVVFSDDYLENRPGNPGRGPGNGPWGGHHGPHGGRGWGPGGPYGPGMMPGYGPGRMPGYGPGMPGMWGGGYGGTLAPPVYLWHHATVPSKLGFVVDTTGSFGFACTVYCGYGHPYMVERGRIVVKED